MDCLRVDFADGWGIARPSKSTPGVILRFEADTEPRLEEIKALVKNKLAEYPELDGKLNF